MNGVRAGSGRERLAALAVGLLAFALVVLAVGHSGDAASSPRLESISGTDRSETIFGSPKGERIAGRGGKDKLVARAGSDTVLGGSGFDKLRGGKGADTLIGGGNGATMIGGEGRDGFNMKDGKRVAGEGRDVIRAADGSLDEINCGPGGRDVAYVDGAEDGIYDCERVIGPGGPVGTEGGS